MAAMPRTRYAGWSMVCVLLGALMVPGFAPWFLWPLVPLTLAALFLVWRRAPLPRALAGFAFGMGVFTAGVYWIYISLHDHGHMAAPLAILALLGFSAVNAAIPALAGAFSAWCSRRGSSPVELDVLLLMPACWTLGEWVRMWLFTGFPWLSVGYSQIPDGPFAGLAPLGGIYACSLAVAWSAAALVTVLLRRDARPLLIPLILAVGAAQAGHVAWTEPVLAPLPVAILQGNVAQDEKFLPAQIIASLRAYRDMAQASSARLIVTPESSLALLRDQLPTEYLDDLRAIGVRNGGDLLVGLFDETAPGVYQNTMTSYGVSPTQNYRKHHLVPFGEFIPLKWLVQPIMDRVLAVPIGDQGAAPLGQPPLAVAGQQLALDICYEDAFGDEIITALPQGTLLVNVSDDAWFGVDVGPEQHLQIAQARALETGRAMVRATNTGVSALIGPDGRVLARAPKVRRTVLEGTVQGRAGSTPYVRFGNLPVVVLILLLLGLGTWPARRRHSSFPQIP